MLIVNFICCLALVTLQVIFYLKFKKTKSAKYFNLFMGFVSGTFLLFLMIYLFILFGGVGGLSEALAQLLVSSPFFVVSLVLMLKGESLNKQINVSQDKKYIRKLAIIIVSIPIGIYLISIVVVDMIVANKTVDYLNTKYGDNDFKVVFVSKDYSYNGIVSATHTGYEVRVTSPIVDDKFIVHVSGTNPFFVKEFCEHYFLLNHYKKEIKEYLGKKYDYTVDFYLAEDKVSQEPGSIPTFADLLSFDAISMLSFTPKNYDTYCSESTIDCAADLAMYLADYFKISENSALEFSIFVSKTEKCEVRLTEKYLDIKTKNGKVYVYGKVNYGWVLKYHN